VKKLRHQNLHHHGAFDPGHEDEKHFFEILQWKSEDSGSHYKQISKLALSSMESEHKVEALEKKVGELIEAKKKLTKEKIAHAFRGLTSE
jgi:hypothetical protein